MTNNIYLKQFIEENFYGNGNKLKSEKYIKDNFQTHYNKIVLCTSFLQDNTPLRIRILYVLENLSEVKKCKACGNKLKIDSKWNFYNKQFCSTKCSANDEIVRSSAIKSFTRVRHSEI